MADFIFVTISLVFFILSIGVIFFFDSLTKE